MLEQSLQVAKPSPQTIKACLHAFAKIQEVAPKGHDFTEQRDSLITKVKSLLAQMEDLSVAETLAVASNVETEPMVECLIRVD